MADDPDADFHVDPDAVDPADEPREQHDIIGDMLDDAIVSSTGGFLAPMHFDMPPLPRSPIYDIGVFSAVRGGIDFNRDVTPYVPPTRVQLWRRRFGWRLTLARERLALRIAPSLRRKDDDWYDD